MGGIWTVSYNVPGNFQVLKCPVPPTWSLIQFKTFLFPLASPSVSDQKTFRKRLRKVLSPVHSIFLRLLLTLPVLPLIFRGQSRWRGVVVGRWKCSFVASRVVICRCSVGVSPSWRLPRWFKVEPPQARRSGSAPWQGWSDPGCCLCFYLIVHFRWLSSSLQQTPFVFRFLFESGINP